MCKLFKYLLQSILVLCTLFIVMVLIGSFLKVDNNVKKVEYHAEADIVAQDKGVIVNPIDDPGTDDPYTPANLSSSDFSSFYCIPAKEDVYDTDDNFYWAPYQVVDIYIAYKSTAKSQPTTARLAYKNSSGETVQTTLSFTNRVLSTTLTTYGSISVYVYVNDTKVYTYVFGATDMKIDNSSPVISSVYVLDENKNLVTTTSKTPSSILYLCVECSDTGNSGILSVSCDLANMTYDSTLGAYYRKYNAVDFNGTHAIKAVDNASNYSTYTDVYSCAYSGVYRIGDFDYELLYNTSEGNVAKIKKCYSSNSFVDIPEIVENDGVTYTVIYVYDDAFTSNIKRVVIPNSSIRYINAFNNIDIVVVNYKTIKLNDKINISVYKAYMRGVLLNTTAVIKGEGNFTGIKLVDYLTEEVQSIDSIIVELNPSSNDEVKIGDYAFSGLTYLKQIEFCDSIIEIGNNVFQGCNLLSKIIFNGDRPIVASSAIPQNDNLKIYHSPDSNKWESGGKSINAFDAYLGFNTSDNGTVKVTSIIDPRDVDNRCIDYQGIVYSCTSGNAEVIGFIGMASSITIPKKINYNGTSYDVLAINDCAFAGINTLVTVAIPNIATEEYPDRKIEIRSNAFRNCENLEYVFIDGKLSSSNNNSVFYGSNKVRVVTFDSTYSLNTYCGVTIVTAKKATGTGCDGIKYTFYNYNKTAIVGVESTNILENQENTSGCTMKDVVIPDMLSYNGNLYEVIGFDRYAFCNNDIVETVTFGMNIGKYQSTGNVAIWDCTFRDCNKLVTINVNANNEYYKSVDGVLFDKVTIKYNCLDDRAPISGSSRLIWYPISKSDESFTIPSGVTIIENYAFYGNTSIKYVYFNSMVNIIGAHAFENCTSLDSITGYSKVTYIGKCAFANCKEFKVIDLTSVCLTYIGSKAFFETGLSGQLDISYAIEYIGQNAFVSKGITGFKIKYLKDEDEELEEFKNPKYFTDSYGALYEKNNDGKIKLLQFPAGYAYQLDINSSTIHIDEIDSYAFYGVKNLRSFIMSDSIQYVGSHAFSGCINLKRFTFGKNYIGDAEVNEDDMTGLFSNLMFEGCVNLSVINVNEENPYFCIDNIGVLYSKDKTVLYYYPQGLTRDYYIVAQSVTNVRANSFIGNSSIKRIVFENTNDTTLKIGANAFSNCSSLKEVYFYSKNMPETLGEKIFDNCDSQLRVYYKNQAGSKWTNGTWASVNCQGFDVISALPNDVVNANTYWLVLRDTSGEKITSDVRVEIEFAYGGKHKSFPVTVDNNGIAKFSLVQQLDEIDVHLSLIHIYISSNSTYKSYDFELPLDEEMCISYITLIRNPGIIGLNLIDYVSDEEGNCTDEENNIYDINSQTFNLNLKEYSSSFESTSYNENGDSTLNINYRYDNISIIVKAFWDLGYDYKNIYLKQGNSIIPLESIYPLEVESEKNEAQFTFMLSTKYLSPDKQIEVVLILNEEENINEEFEYHKTLNINVFEFEINPDDINIDTSDIEGNIDLSNDNSILSMFLRSDGMKFKLSDDVKLVIKPKGSTVEVSMIAKKKLAKEALGNISSDFKKGYEENHEAHNKFTYFYQFYDPVTNCTYNIRFARGTEAYGYFFYRLYIYRGLPGVNYSDKVKEEFGGVMLSNMEQKLSGRKQVVAKAAIIYVAASTYVYAHDEYENKITAGVLGIDEPKLTIPKDAYTYNEEDKKLSKGTNSFSLEGSIEGKLVFEFKDSYKPVLKSGEIKGTLEFVYKYNAQFMVWVIPVNLEVKISAKGSLDIKVKLDDGFNISLDEIAAQIALEIEASLGVGCELASIGIYGKAGAEFKFNVLPAFEVETIKVYGEFGAYVKVLWIKKTHKFMSGEKYIVDNRDEIHNRQIVRSTVAQDYAFITRGYTFSADIDENASIIKLNNDIYKVYFANISGEEYDIYNSVKMVYSKWINNAWSDPVIIDDNGFVDTYFDIYQEENSSYLVYTQQTKKFDSENVDDTYAIAKGLTVKYLDISNGFAGTKLVVKDGTNEESSNYKYIPQISVVNGEVTIVWAENKDNNIFGVSPYNDIVETNGGTNTIIYGTEANSIWQASLVNGSWEISKLLDNMTTITNLGLLSDGRIIYIVDEDGDLANNNDCRLFYLNNNTSEVIDGNKSIVYFVANNNQLLYLDIDGNLTMLDSNDEYPIINNGDYQVIRSENDIKSIIYTQVPLNGTHSVLYGIFKTNSGWSNPVTLYDCGQDDVYIASYDGLLIDANTLLVNLSFINNDGDCVQISYNPILDLQKNDIICADPVVDFSNHQLLIDIHNDCLINNSIYYSFDGIHYTKYTGSLDDYSLEAGESGTISLDYDSSQKSIILHLSNSNSSTGDFLSKPIDTSYVDFVILGKQIIVSGENKLLVAIKNVGNIALNDNAYIEVYKGTINGEKVETFSIGEIGNDYSYLELLLDESLINDLDTVLTVKVVTENNTLDEVDKYLDNNFVTLYLNNLSDIKNGGNESFLSTNKVSFSHNQMEDVVVTVYHHSDSIDFNNELAIVGAKTDANNDGIYETVVSFDHNKLNQLENGSHLFVIDGHEFIIDIDKKNYEVTFVIDEDNYSVCEVEEGTMPICEMSTEKEGMEFVGWDKEVVKANGNVTYTAVYATPKKSYAVVWDFGNGVFIKQNIEEGTQLEPIAFSFGTKDIAGWDINNDGRSDELPIVNNDITLVALYGACGHGNSIWIEEVKDTCEENGTIGHYHCPDCGINFDKDNNEVESLVIVSTGHNYGEWIEEAKATCESDGAVGHYHCDKCNKDFDKDHNELTSIVIASTGHNYGEWIEEVKATCEDNGVAGHYHCDKCNKDFDKDHKGLTSIVIISAGHNFGELIPGRAATCEENGIIAHYHCVNCGKDYDENHNELTSTIITSTGHNYGEWIEEVKAGCETDGVVGHYHCDKCNKDFDKDHNELASIVISSTGHNYGEWIEEEKATCEANGVVGHYHCDKCNKDFDKDHNELTSIVITSTGHNYGEWIEEISATYDENGVVGHYHCDKCNKNFDKDHNKIQNISIPKLVDNNLSLFVEKMSAITGEETIDVLHDKLQEAINTYKGVINKDRVADEYNRLMTLMSNYNSVVRSFNESHEESSKTALKALEVLVSNISLLACALYENGREWL